MRHSYCLALPQPLALLYPSPKDLREKHTSDPQRHHPSVAFPPSSISSCEYIFSHGTKRQHIQYVPLHRRCRDDAVPQMLLEIMLMIARLFIDDDGELSYARFDRDDRVYATTHCSI
jgi:hypothetical protein